MRLVVWKVRVSQLNIPWKCGGVGDEDYISAFQHVILLMAEQFAHDLTIIAAGKQPVLERLVDVGGCGYPAFITLNTL